MSFVQKELINALIKTKEVFKQPRLIAVSILLPIIGLCLGIFVEWFLSTYYLPNDGLPLLLGIILFISIFPLTGTIISLMAIYNIKEGKSPSFSDLARFIGEIGRVLVYTMIKKFIISIYMISIYAIILGLFLLNYSTGSQGPAPGTGVAVLVILAGLLPLWFFPIASMLQLFTVDIILGNKQSSRRFFDIYNRLKRKKANLILYSMMRSTIFFVFVSITVLIFWLLSYVGGAFPEMISNIFLISLLPVASISLITFYSYPAYYYSTLKNLNS